MLEWLKIFFGGGSNKVVDTIEVFRENTEKASKRSSDYQNAALSQFGAEFRQNKRTSFDAFMDGLNRIPRPALALGTLALFIAAMIDPVWFAARMSGIALVPEPLWWLLGVVVSFYFGARHQNKGQQFQREIAAALVPSNVIDTVNTIHRIEQIGEDQDDTQEQEALQFSSLEGVEPEDFDDNAALQDWHGKLG